MLYMLVGLPASGKSTIAKHYTTNVVSSDAVRAQLYGDEAIQGKACDVFSVVYHEIANYLAQGKDVALDATNLTKRDRAEGIRLAHQYHQQVTAVVCPTPIDVCLTRNAQRNRTVPEFVIERMARRYQEPSPKEGFDKIITAPTV